jgi:hypothetical protein
MLVIAIVTAGLLGTTHTGSAPAVNAPSANAPAVVFDRPAPPAPSRPKPAPVKSVPRPGPVVCYGYTVNPVFDPKYQTILNAGLSQAACINGPPSVPVEP